MLKQLLLTTLLTTGVATTTPVYKAQNLQKQAENVENYTLNLSNGQINQQIYNNVNTDNDLFPYNVGTDYERIRQISGFNTAINVLGTTYITQVKVSDAYMVMNKTYMNTNTGTVSRYATRALTILQIDSYNYNRDTTINLTVSLGLDSFYFAGQDYTIKNQWYQRAIFTTTQSNWSTLIGRQQQSFNASIIDETIRDANNGYLYTQTYNNIIKYDDSQTDTIAINLLPNDKTYVVIQYVPLVEIEETYSQKTLPVRQDSQFDLTDWMITGTNVIPTETYEVVDIPGLCWDILAMPFAFVSQAFNFTLFPGTPYQVNISNLFLSIIAIFVFIWLITLFFKMKQ